MLFRSEPIWWNLTALATTFVLTICCLTAVVLLGIRVIGLRSRFPFFFHRMAGTVALFAAPSGYLLVLTLTPTWFGTSYLNSTMLDRGMLLVLISVFFCEFIGFCLLAIRKRKRAIASRLAAFFLLVHFTFWGFFLFGTRVGHHLSKPCDTCFRIIPEPQLQRSDWRLR